MSSTSEATTRRRVKLYMLNEERQWDDKGTGHVSALYNDSSCICLVVISENDGSPLLESKIQPETAYQKQQETLIVWSEGDSVDLALSFQEKAGCDDIWEKICSVQGKDPSVDVTQEVVEETDDTDDVETYSLETNPTLQNIELPPCEITKLDEISEIFNTHLHILHKRERLVAAVDRSNYIRQLIDLFHKCEDLDDLASLHCLYDIFRQLILFNKQVLYETLFSDDTIMDVIGILEYSPGGRTRHRDFLKNQANFKEVLPLHNSKLINKIHQTYRVQYIQDCCLPPPSLFDEQSMSDLKAFIANNKMEILSALQEDNECMMRLFTCLKSPDTSDSHRRELALFVKEFCNLSIQTDQKEAFLSTLSAHGALSTVEFLLSNKDREVRSAALIILQAFVENQPSVVRTHACKEGSRQTTDNIIVNLMITQLLEDPDPELGDAYQLNYMIRILIDPDNSASRFEKSEFLGFFYRRCMSTLTKPLFDHTENDTMVDDNYHSALVLSNVLELLIFCIENHTYYMKNYCLHHDLIKRVTVLLKSAHKFLVLGAVRLVRKMLQLKDEFYNRYLTKNKLIKPIIDCFVGNGHRYNMIDSAIIELFEFVLIENLATIIDHVVEEFWDVLGNVTYVNTFKRLKDRFGAGDRPGGKEDVNALFKEGLLGSNSPIPSLRGPVNARYVREQSFDDEEQWFNQDDDKDQSSEAAETDDGDLPLGFSSSPPSSPTMVANNSPTQAPSSSSFTLLVPSSAADKDDDADDPIPHLLNRRVGGHGFPPIAINIKSTNLGFLHEAEGETKEREEEQEQEHEMTSSRNPLKRPSDTISSDESEEGESRHSKRSLIDIVDRDHIAAVAATSIKHVDYADKPSSATEPVSAVTTETGNQPIVGLVDYSDGESDEEDQEEGESEPPADPVTTASDPQKEEAEGEANSSSSEGTADSTQ